MSLPDPNIGPAFSCYLAHMAKATRVNTKTPKKRPDKVGDLVGVRVQDDLAKAIDDWRRKQEDLPGRPEAIRRLVEAGLAAIPRKRAK
jgi:hypothetical protein